jgi:anti-sigma regulatory factor (Ser/Thr protein kinase)
MSEGPHRDVLADFSVASRPDGQRRVRRMVGEAVAPLHLPPGRWEALETAVSEAVMNAIEHGNGGDPALAVRVRVSADRDAVVVRVADQGGADGEVVLTTTTTPPDLEAKLRGEEPLRGWGLFLMEALVDEVHVEQGGAGRVVELLLRRRDQPTT